MADSTYTTGRNLLIEWIRSLNSPNSSTVTPKSLDADIVDIVAIMRALGMKLVSFEKTGEVHKGGSLIVIGSKLSGLKYVMEKRTSHCNCPTENSESSFWSVSGIGSRETLAQADSSVFPKMSTGLNQMLHNTLIDILHVMREVEMKPKKIRNYMICSREIVHSTRFSPNTAGMRHASSLPVILINPSTPNHHRVTYPVSPKLSELHMSKNYSPVKKPAIDSQEALIEKLESLHEDIKIVLSVLKPAKTQFATSQSVQKVAIGIKKDSEGCHKGAIARRFSLYQTPTSMRPESTRPVRTTISSVRTPHKLNMANNNEGSEGDGKVIVRKSYKLDVKPKGTTPAKNSVS